MICLWDHLLQWCVSADKVGKVRFLSRMLKGVPSYSSLALAANRLGHFREFVPSTQTSELRELQAFLEIVPYHVPFYRSLAEESRG